MVTILALKAERTAAERKARAAQAAVASQDAGHQFKRAERGYSMPGSLSTCSLEIVTSAGADVAWKKNAEGPARKDFTEETVR